MKPVDATDPRLQVVSSVSRLGLHLPRDQQQLEGLAQALTIWTVLARLNMVKIKDSEHQRAEERSMVRLRRVQALTQSLVSSTAQVEVPLENQREIPARQRRIKKGLVRTRDLELTVKVVSMATKE